MIIGKHSNICTGLILSRKKTDQENAGCRYAVVTLRSQRNNGSLDENEFSEFYSEGKIDARYIAREGDVLLRTTFPYTATFISRGLEGTVIPSNFCIIRAQIKGSLAPEFLSIYLNSDKAKKHFQSVEYASTINSIKIDDIRLLRIPDLSIEKQMQIIEIHRLKSYETMLFDRLLAEKEKLYKTVINSIMKEHLEEKCKL